MERFSRDYYCMCDEPIEVMPSNPRLARAYVPYQIANCLYNPRKALKAGTIFPELDIPWKKEPRQSRRYIYD